MVPFYRQRIVVQSCYYIIVACCLVPARLISVCCITQTWGIPKSLKIWRPAAPDLGGPQAYHTDTPEISALGLGLIFPALYNHGSHTWSSLCSASHHAKGVRNVCLHSSIPVEAAVIRMCRASYLMPWSMLYMYWCLISVYKVVIFPCMFHHGHLLCHSLIIGVPALLNFILSPVFVWFP